MIPLAAGVVTTLRTSAKNSVRELIDYTTYIKVTFFNREIKNITRDLTNCIFFISVKIIYLNKNATVYIKVTFKRHKNDMVDMQHFKSITVLTKSRYLSLSSAS